MDNWTAFMPGVPGINPMPIAPKINKKPTTITTYKEPRSYNSATIMDSKQYNKENSRSNDTETQPEKSKSRDYKKIETKQHQKDTKSWIPSRPDEDKKRRKEVPMINSYNRPFGTDNSNGRPFSFNTPLKSPVQVNTKRVPTTADGRLLINAVDFYPCGYDGSFARDEFKLIFNQIQREARVKARTKFIKRLQ